MTNAASGDTMNRIYDEIYAAHPEYEKLWFCWDGKPMIIGDSSDTQLSKPEKGGKTDGI